MTPDAPDTATSIRVRGAIAGDRENLGWIVTRFSPLLRAQAMWRLGQLAGQIDVEDILAEAWLVLLQKRNEIVLDVKSSLVEHNHANEGGSAIFFVSNNESGSITIQDSIFRDNPKGTFETPGLPGFYVIAKGPAEIIDSDIQ